MINISLMEFILIAIASFRLTRLIVHDTITEFIRKPFHDIVEETASDGTVEKYLIIKGTGIKYWIGELLSCHWCVGIWSATFLYSCYQFLPLYFEPIIIVFAIAGAAAFIEVMISKWI